MEGQTPGSQLKASITDATTKIESIIDDAERAASQIRSEARSDAERESRAIIAQSAKELAEVVEPLKQRVENLRVEGAALMHELENATLRLVELTKTAGSQVEKATDASEPEAPAKPAPPKAPALVEDAKPPAAPGPVPVAYPGTGADKASSEPPEEAVLRATQMAVAGNSRAEIESALADEFGIADTGPVVDDILGPA